MKKRSVRWILSLAALLLLLAAVYWGLTRYEDAAPIPIKVDAEVIKVLIEDDGIYRISAADLARFGWEDIDKDSVRLQANGKDHPFILEGEDNSHSIIFYGQAPSEPYNRYTSLNAYLLFQESSTAPLGQLEAAPAAFSDQRTVFTTINIEENKIYNPRLEEGRPWVWFQLPAPGSQSVNFDLPDIAEGPAALKLEWFGNTESLDINPDHHLRIYLNEILVADHYWDGLGAETIEVELANGILKKGDNILRFEAPGDTGVMADIIIFDSLSLSYPHPTTAITSGLAFTSAGSSLHFTKETDLFDISQPFNYLSGITGSGPLQTKEGGKYIAFPAGEYLQPAKIMPAATNRDLRSLIGANYLAIGSPGLLEAASPLLAHRQQEGLSTVSIITDEIYDQFGNGLETPYAIRSFLRYAVDHWDTPPGYVLLIGDWSYDPSGHISEPVESGLPSFLIFTEFGGETVSDIELVKLDDDELPDLAVGRLPARTKEQVRIAVEKTIAFETIPPDAGWLKRILALADPTEAGFTRDAEEYLAEFSQGYEPVLIAPLKGEEGTPDRISAEVQSGVLLMSYFGHGSITQLGKDTLFTAEQAAGLQNGPLTPIMVNITCLAGLFTHPTVESLSEAILWNEQGGAVAALGATSLTLPVYQANLSNGFARGVVSSELPRLGDVLLAAQRQVPISQGAGAIEVLDTFLLFGDPALILP